MKKPNLVTPIKDERRMAELQRLHAALAAAVAKKKLAEKRATNLAAKDEE